jgi:acetyl-CoA hydrolase
MSPPGIDLTAHIEPGDTVLIAQGTAEPRSLVQALVEQAEGLQGVRLFIGASFTGLLRPEHARNFRLCSFGGIARTSALTREGVVDVLPIHLGTLPHLITSGRLPVDVVLAQVSEPDERGGCSLGLVADYLPAAISVARTVIVEVNPNVPFTHGDTTVSVDRFAATVRDDRPLIEVAPRVPSAEEDMIGRLVAEQIPDGATLQLGVGGAPDVALRHLSGRRDLGIHSGLIGDAVMALIEDGTVTNARKPIDRGLTVTGALFGTGALYRWADHNRRLRVRSLAHTHDPAVLAEFHDLHAVNSALEVDLTGQINAEVAGGRYVGAIGGQGAFARAAAISPGGRSIIALPSTARGGATSRIVARLPDSVVTTPRSDADLIVTEHGVADLRGLGLADRAARLIAIAHPDHRAELDERWHRRAALEA